jgi:hypothetical protein
VAGQRPTPRPYLLEPLPSVPRGVQIGPGMIERGRRNFIGFDAPQVTPPG